jgi:predicted enzyme related to lactoylglutathione lyase
LSSSLATFGHEDTMIAKAVTPILNVSNFLESVAWFEKLGWKKGFQWGKPPTFGAVCAGEFEIFLCLNGQGSRGKGSAPTTRDNDESKGVWMSIWVDDVDAMHQRCLEQGLEVTMPPTNEPWGVREMHVQHPDGHVFRISKANEGE